MGSIVGRLERVIRAHILRSVPASGVEGLQPLDLRSLLEEYGAWRARFIAPAPRVIHVSQELQSSAKRQQHARDLDALEEKFANGKDLTPHLSARVHNPFRNTAAPELEHRTDRDALLGDYGLHHLHLSTRTRRGAARRDDNVLFAAFTAGEAYLVGIYSHGDNWAAEDVFRLLIRNWPNAGLVHEARSVIGVTRRFSDDDRREPATRASTWAQSRWTAGSTSQGRWATASPAFPHPWAVPQCVSLRNWTRGGRTSRVGSPGNPRLRRMPTGRQRLKWAFYGSYRDDGWGRTAQARVIAEHRSRPPPKFRG